LGERRFVFVGLKFSHVYPFCAFLCESFEVLLVVTGK
jgi:hypothetical protein